MGHSSNENISIEITNSKLFDFLTVFEFDEQIVDLHNEYICELINLEPENPDFIIEFLHINEKHRVTLEFQKAVIKKMSLSFSLENDVLDSMYRGRFEENNYIVDISNNEQVYFYLEFSNGNSFELLSSKVFLHFYPAGPGFVSPQILPT